MSEVPLYGPFVVSPMTNPRSHLCIRIVDCIPDLH